MDRNIFVMGLDDLHRDLLRSVRGAEDYAFHGLLDYDEVVHPSHYPIEGMLDQARRELNACEGKIDAIIGHWDFPTPPLIAELNAEYGLRGPSLASVLTAEHKYWCRLVQQRVLPEHTPDFQAVNPFDSRAAESIKLEYPFWLKPTIAFSSLLAFYIGNRRQLDQALDANRKGINLFGDAFQVFNKRCTLPPELPAEKDGYWCIAESIIGGEQCTAEGYVLNGKAQVYGIVDSFREGAYQSSFSRYQLPSGLPEGVQQRICNACERLVPELGLDNTAFNIEFFWDKDWDRIWLLEVNSRLSKSHSPLFLDVMGATHHEVAIDVALGREPDFPRYEGRCQVAAKFMMRRHRDAVVTRVPTKQEIADLEARYPGALIEIAVEEGMRLSDLKGQDSYSYEVAVVFMGGADTETLKNNYERFRQELPLEFDEKE